MVNKILLVGDGGHCKSIIDSLLELNIYDEIGIISKKVRDLNYFGVKCIGSDDNLFDLYKDGWRNAFISLGSVGDTKNREILFKQLKDIGFNLPNIIDKTSIVSKNSKLGKGNFIGKDSVINAGVTVEDCCIINTGSVVEHECNICSFSHISSNSTLCGNVTIKKGVHIGAGSVIKQGIVIGDNTLIGIGSIVTKDIENDVVAFGNPCKVINKQ